MSNARRASSAAFAIRSRANPIDPVSRLVRWQYPIAAMGMSNCTASMPPRNTATGLRQPIEVWALQTPRDTCSHGLISGHRRLLAFRRIRDARDAADHTHIPAFIRAPETLSLRQCLRLAAALRRGYADLIEHTLQECQGRSPGSQWVRLSPILTEAERSPDEKTSGPHGTSRPRRTLYLRQGLLIRREMSGDGWILRFSGPEARKGGLIDDVLDEVERWCDPKGKG